MVRVISHFIPASYLVEAVKGMVLRDEGISSNWNAVGALLIATALGLVLGMKLFRWEKEEKIRTSAKLWIVAVLLPFVLLGAWQVHLGEDVNKSSFFDRDTQRKQTLLISGARIIADGKVIESGAVLVQGGKVIQIYETNPPDAGSLKVQPIDASGKTVVISKGEMVDASEIFSR